MPQPTVHFAKAKKYRLRVRLSLEGLGKTGKTVASLKIATELGRLLLGREPRIAVLDSEGDSALKYADLFEFDHHRLDSCSPEMYIRAIEVAVRDGYDFCILDSLSHEWIGKDGALALVDQASKRSQSNNQFFAWRDVTPMHNALIETILRAPLHIIATLRLKSDWVVERDDKGRMIPRKVGLAPIQREGLEYEFDHSARMTLDHELIVQQTCCDELDGKIFKDPGKKTGANVAQILARWLSSGAEPPAHALAQANPINALMNDAAVRALFDELGATEAKRRATCDKYPDKDTLLQRLEARIKERGAKSGSVKNGTTRRHGSAVRGAGLA
jgi:hypothetical protein